MFSKLFTLIPLLTVCFAAAVTKSNNAPDESSLTYGLTVAEIVELKHDYPTVDWDDILSTPPTAPGNFTSPTESEEPTFSEDFNTPENATSSPPPATALSRRARKPTGRITCKTHPLAPYAIDVWREAANLFVQPPDLKCRQLHTTKKCTWMTFHMTAGAKICSTAQWARAGYQYCRVIGLDMVELSKRCVVGARASGMIGYPNRNVWAIVSRNPWYGT